MPSALQHVAVDQRRGVAGAEAVVDVDDRDARGAGVEHAEQRREAAEARRRSRPRSGTAITGRVDEAADDAGQRALHAGHDDQRVGARAGARRGASRRCRPATPTSRSCSTRAPSMRAVTAASSATGTSDVPARRPATQPDGPARRPRSTVDRARVAVVDGVGQRPPERAAAAGVDARDHEQSLVVLEQRARDLDQLLRRLARAS